jgi:hypothetical protein
MCITLELESNHHTEERWQMAFQEPVSPCRLDPRWEFKGYDVADQYFTSGLSNCACGTQAMENLRMKFAGDINGNGLISTVEKAAQFKDCADQSVSSHAPFFIYGMYQL